jgi:hypothetical protein
VSEADNASKVDEKKHLVRIHIDQKPHESPNPTTGEALYILGDVRPGLDLYREVRGDKEDPPIPNGPEIVHLREDEHFHSGPPCEITIFVNTRKKKTTARELTFEQIVALAFDPVPAKALFTVTYQHGICDHEGSLRPGQKVRIKDGMCFNVTETTES